MNVEANQICAASDAIGTSGHGGSELLQSYSVITDPSRHVCDDDPVTCNQTADDFHLRAGLPTVPYSNAFGVLVTGFNDENNRIGIWFRARWSIEQDDIS